MVAGVALRSRYASLSVHLQLPALDPTSGDVRCALVRRTSPLVRRGTGAATARNGMEAATEKRVKRTPPDEQHNVEEATVEALAQHPASAIVPQRFGNDLPDEMSREDYVPIRGWERYETALLLEALWPVLDTIEDLEQYARDSLDFAARYLRRHNGIDPHGLNIQQIAALNLYTKMNVGNPNQTFYTVMNRALNKQNRIASRPYFAYINLVVTAARLLPNACPRKLWRAYPNVEANWKEKFTKGKEIIWWGFSSTTKTANVLENAPGFFPRNGERTLFMLDCISGVDISPYSDYPEDEVLLLPGACFEVEHTMAPDVLGGVLQIVMRQKGTRHDLLLHTENKDASARQLTPSAPPASEITPALAQVVSHEIEVPRRPRCHITTEHCLVLFVILIIVTMVALAVWVVPLLWGVYIICVALVLPCLYDKEDRGGPLLISLLLLPAGIFLIIFFAAIRVEYSDAYEISGCESGSDGNICGRFEITDDVCNDAPVYEKVGNEGKTIMYMRYWETTECIVKDENGCGTCMAACWLNCGPTCSHWCNCEDEITGYSTRWCVGNEQLCKTSGSGTSGCTIHSAEISHPKKNNWRIRRSPLHSDYAPWQEGSDQRVTILEV